MEIFKGVNGNRKTYVVFPKGTSDEDIRSGAARYFKKGKDHVNIVTMYRYKDELFFEAGKATTKILAATLN